MTTRRRFLAGSAALAAACRAPALQLRSARPNILLIYTDQQRHDTIRELGAAWVDTPNIDRLARQGVSFTYAFAPSPVCMAARWSLQTGQWTSTHRCYSNHHPGPLPVFHLPGLLRRQGYRTGLAGKNHTFLKTPDCDVFEEAPQPKAGPGARERAEWIRTTAAVKYPRVALEAAAGGMEADPMRGVTDTAVRFLGATGDRPFFLFASYLNPHPPYYVPEPFFSRYANRPVPAPAVEPEGLKAAGKPFRQQFHQCNVDAITPFDAGQRRMLKRVYGGMVSLVDAEIGRLLDELEARGLAENTLVVFTSDHGDYLGDHGLITKSPAMYDCLTRVPFIVRWPGRAMGGRRDSRFISHVDLLPSFLEAAGAPVPDEVQGGSLLPLFADPERRVRDAAFSEYGVPGEPYNEERIVREGLCARRYYNPGNARLPWEGNPVALAGRLRMIRTERWKFVEEIGGADELYDLSDDPNELRNIARRKPFKDICQEMRTRLARWKASLA